MTYYVLSNGIFASANENKEDACSIVRPRTAWCCQSGKDQVALNQLARDICDQKISLIDSWDRLEQCKNIPNYKKKRTDFLLWARKCLLLLSFWWKLA